MQLVKTKEEDYENEGRMGPGFVLWELTQGGGQYDELRNRRLKQAFHFRIFTRMKKGVGLTDL